MPTLAEAAYGLPAIFNGRKLYFRSVPDSESMCILMSQKVETWTRHNKWEPGEYMMVDGQMYQLMEAETCS